MIAQKQTLQKRFPVFTGLALFICFALFPLFLIDAALSRVLQIQYEKNLDRAGKQLDSALNTLEKYSSDSHFAHLLLKDTFQKALNSDTPKAELHNQLQQLKQQHPGMFFFIVWDESGSIIREATDETAFAYILREVYKLLHDLAENCRRYYPGAPEKIAGIDRRLKLVRHYIGRIVSQNWLQRPLQSERKASTIIAEASGKKNQFWYAVDQRITMLAFIHSDFFVGNPGLKYAIKRLQADNPALQAGFTRYPIDPETIFLPDKEAEPADIAIAVSRFENLYPGNLLRHKGKLLSYRYINPDIRAFCYLPEQMLPDVAQRKMELAIQLLLLLGILIFLAWLASKKHQITHVPAQIKLSALFLYAGGIPLLIIFIIGADYLQQKRHELIYAGQSHGLEQLRQIDDGFVDYLASSAEKIRKLLQNHIDKDLPLEQQKNSIAQLRAKLGREFEPGSMMLFDTNGRNHIGTEDNMPFPDPAAISQVSKDTLEFLNKSNTFNFSLSKISRPVAIDFGYRSQFISNFSVGSHETYAFFGSTGRPEQYRLSGMFFLFWRTEDLQRKYLELTMHAKPLMTAHFPESDLFLKTKTRPGRQFGDLLHKASSLLIVRSSEVSDLESNYTAAAMRGNHLNKSCLGIRIPLQQIDKEMQQHYQRFAVLAMLFLFFCGGGIIMMRQRLLEPLKQFKEAIEAIGQRNFRYRLQHTGNNEFGQLSRALDHTLENLSELEVARIVQENILPGREYRQNQLELLATLIQMSHIGGDYYDYFAVNPEISGVFIGDVSGHGISSALVMAMARSAMIFENLTEPDQTHLMHTMNDVIYQMRKSGSKDYMSGLSFFINSRTGEYSLVNAGHCPPILIRKAAEKAELQKCSGLYFGFREEFEAQPLHGKMEPGDFMVLYTDSWVESTAKGGIPFGFARFEQALLNCCNNDLAIFSRQMYATIENWEEERADDMTLLLIKFGENNGC
ncbi:MAG: Serine phosphatase RsbU, regulator of sigma subunit [Candidatus Rifleibacterium amylolyticum]|nr:MAG: Serine phosphatase RsbU, regulator of sigma subunit [Candidatus Rifleibacterium amylolyticum]